MVRENLQTQYWHYELELRVVRAKMNAIIMGITPVLNFIDGNPAPPPVGDLDVNMLPPDPFVERYRAAWVNFRVYVHSAMCTAVGHALLVVWPLYSGVDLRIIDGGFTKGMEDKVANQLTEEATELTFKLIKDQDIFGDKEQQNQNN
jgi:hypothetical protein